ncbi:MAG: preprotein translocase subunit SecE [Actinomycetota bacterium]
MNRQTKRLLARQQAAEKRGQQRLAPSPRAPGAPLEKRKRTPPRQFLREVRSELKKVAWPTRTEVATYTLVVLVTVTFVTLYVFGLDNAFARGVLKVFAK